MKKILLCASVFGATMFQQVYADQIISIQPISLLKGAKEVDLPIYLKNSGNIESIAFFINLPEGLTFVGEKDGGEFYADFNNSNRLPKRGTNSVSVKGASSQSVGYLFYNTEAKTIASGEGLLVTLSLDVDASFDGGIISFSYGKEIGATACNNSIDYEDYYCVDYYYNYKAGTIGEGGLSTFSCPAGVEITGATAYYGTIGDDSFVMSPYIENKVPAETGAILKGTAGASYTISSVDVADLSEKNDLVASVERTIVEADKTYVIATGADGTGFYRYSGTAIPAGKAYLNVPVGPSNASLRVVTNITGIDELESEESAIDAYDLFGNKVENANGQVVIENGKKIIRH